MKSSTGSATTYISDCGYYALTVYEYTGRVSCSCINGADRHSFLRDIAWDINSVEHNLEEAIEILRKEDVVFSGLGV